MAIPLLAMVIALTFFFGFAMTNQQHVKASARYIPWRAVEDGSGVSADELNTMFFHERAESIGAVGGIGPDETLREIVDRASWESAPAGDLLDLCITEHWPHGRSASVSAEFPSSVAAWRRFTGAIRHGHVRDGVEWRRGQVSYLEPIRDQFLMNLDATILGIDDAPLRESLRRLYLQRW